jgi:hypothetical protein
MRWKPYFEGVNKILLVYGTYFFPIWIKFDTADVYKHLCSDFEFRENRHIESYTLKESLSLLSAFLVLFLKWNSV